MKWDGTRQPFPSWERDHSLDSAMKSSVVWFFQRTASLIGRDRMHRALAAVGYAEDTFEGNLTTFWMNGDLVVSPHEQIRFLKRLARDDLPVQRRHVDTVKQTLLMPPGTITNAAGIHAFVVEWPDLVALRAKTGNTAVGLERVSWLVGHIETRKQQYVFASRVRSGGELPGTAGAEVARRLLNAHAPRAGGHLARR
jgi:beta-lactamase class D